MQVSVVTRNSTYSLAYVADGVDVTCPDGVVLYATHAYLQDGALWAYQGERLLLRTSTVASVTPTV